MGVWTRVLQSSSFVVQRNIKIHRADSGTPRARVNCITLQRRGSAVGCGDVGEGLKDSEKKRKR